MFAEVCFVSASYYYCSAKSINFLGILADGEGSGKTMCCVALIQCNPRHSLSHLINRNANIFETKATLIVCPNILIPQWEQTIIDNTASTDHPLVVKYASNNPTINKIRYEDLLNVDVFIIANELLENRNYIKKATSVFEAIVGSSSSGSDIKSRSKLKALRKAATPLISKFGWHRIFFDQSTIFLKLTYFYCYYF